jgi:SAM-dependent methyltransferase
VVALSDLPDWEQRWRARVEAWERGVGRVAADGADRFGRMAQRFAQNVSRAGSDPDPLLPIIEPLARGGTVLDVGAGVGRYTLPLAAVARRVVAVEPSPAMCRLLEERLRAAAAGGVRIVPSRFEEADLDPADFVLCAHVVYFAADGAGFVRLADGLARRAVAFVVRHDPMPLPALALWPRYRNDPPPSPPGFADLYNLLLQLGHAPNVTFYRRRYEFPVESVEEAQEDAGRLLGVPVSREDAASLVGSHRHLLREACVWWEK